MASFTSVETRLPTRVEVVFAYGFRPFFLATAGWAIAALVLWIAALAGALPAWLSVVDLAWHQHEMLFGTFSSALAGFVLTALPEWTKSEPLTGSSLAWLFGLWVAGRVAMLIGGSRFEIALLTAAFLPVVTGVAVIVLVRTRPPRLVLFVGLLAILSVLAVWWQAARTGLVATEPTSLALPVLLIYAALVTLASGRIVPIVSQASLRADASPRRLRAEPASSEVAAMTLTLLAGFIVFNARAEITGWIAFAAAAAQIHRLCEWWIGRSCRRAYVWPFHLASIMIAVAACAIGLGSFGVPVPVSSIAHSLGLGSAALTTLTVMTIVSLLHTGHELRFPLGASLALVMLACASLARAAAPLLDADLGINAMNLAGSLWVGAFLLYAVVVSPKLIRPRIDGRPG